MNNNIFTIYRHTNKINNKVYIGITSQKPEKRWGKNGIGYKKQKRFWNAIQKYGWDNFEHEILYTELTEEEAYALEKELIKMYNSNNPLYGYNNSTGGEKSALGCHFIWSEEAKKRLSEIRTGRVLLEEHREKIRQTRIGQRWNEEQRDKMRSANNPKARKVAQYDKKTGELIRIWDCISDAARELNINASGIINCCKGKTKTAYGFIWRYADEDQIAA